MVSGRAIRAGAAFIEMGVRNTALFKGLRVASARLKAFGLGVRRIGLIFAGLAATVIVAFGAMLNKFASVGDEVDKMRKRTGFSAETLSALSFAAEQSGASLQSLGKAVKTMARFVIDAARGLSTQVDMLELMGLTVADIQGLSPEDTFLKFANAIADLEDPLKRAAVAQVVFGRSGTELLPLLNEGREGIRALMEEARKLGLVFDNETAAEAAAVTDTMNRLRRVLRQIVFTVGSAVAPAFLDLAERIKRSIVPVLDWIKQNKQLFVTALKVVGIVGAIGVGLIVLGAVIGSIGAIIGGLAAVFAVIAAVVAKVGLVLAFLVSPVGLVIAAVAALAIAVGTHFGFIGQLTTWLGNRFKAMKDFAVRTFGLMAKAIRGGEIKLAFQLLWAQAQVIWLRGVNIVKSIFRGFWTGILDTVDTAAFALVAA